MKNIFDKSLILMGVVYGIAFFLLFFCFQNPTFYKASLGKISHTYRRVILPDSVGNKEVVEKITAPFTNISDKNLVHWDAEYYNTIRKYQYFPHESAKTPEKEAFFRDCSFAFFPLFAWIWKLSQLPATFVILLNFSLFLISILALSHLLIEEEKRKKYFFAFSLLMPSTLIFLIPYSEAVFFSMMTVAIWGMKKEKYVLTFIGLMFAAMTRPAVTLVGAALVGAEILLLLKHQNIGYFVKELGKKFLPLLVGTFVIISFQMYCGSGSWFKFMEVQKNWGTKLAFPNGITDWSWEGFGLDVGWLFFAFPLVVYGLLHHYFLLLKAKNFPPNLLIGASMLLVSGGYLALVSFFAVFLHGGCINSLFRYAFCSPFFFVIAAHFFNQSAHISLKKIVIPLFTSLIMSALFLGMNHYNRTWNFERMGYILFVLLTFALFFIEKLSLSCQKIIFGILFLLSLVWNTYLFNMYLCDGWIFT